MIRNFDIRLTNTQSGSSKLTGYHLYACLLSMLSSETADALHENQRSPLSQSVIYSDDGSLLWRISSFDDELSEEIAAALSRAQSITAEKAGAELKISSIAEQRIGGFQDILGLASGFTGSDRIRLSFTTTTALKKSGEFLVFPDAELIIKNLWSSWNAVFPETPFDDDDALALIVGSTNITAYHLSSSIYRMKGSGIRGFFGSLTLGTRLSEPMRILLYCLLVFSQFSGTGVKTALGMGRTSVLPPDDPRRA